ncbi:STAS domain-containing protein [Acidicapsa ligni]|uniref:STAS domain-containing protein n=1 Tax=Acidicapsa ligni TaxID=542300 RepID=UPI0037BEC05D
MLRIQRTENGDIVFRVSGRINAENVPELTALFISEEKHRPIVLDLKDLTLVDQDAVRFLESFETNGTTLQNCPAYVREWITKDRGDHELK